MPSGRPTRVMTSEPVNTNCVMPQVGCIHGARKVGREGRGGKERGNEREGGRGGKERGREGRE